MRLRDLLLEPFGVRKRLVQQCLGLRGLSRDVGSRNLGYNLLIGGQLLVYAGDVGEDVPESQFGGGEVLSRAVQLIPGAGQ